MASAGLILGIIAVLLVVLLIVFLFQLKKKGWKHEVNYDALFVLGVVFMVIGMANDGSAMWIVGLVFIAVSLLNRKKVKKKRR